MNYFIKYYRIVNLKIVKHDELAPLSQFAYKVKNSIEN